MRILLAFMFSLALAAQAAAQVPDATDAEVEKGIEINWNRMTANLMLGERVVGKDPAPQACTSDTISLGQFEFLLDAEKAGYAKIGYWSDFHEFAQGKTFSRQEMLDLAAQGVVKKFTVTPTKRARRWETNLSITGRTGCMGFRVGEYDIHKITRNEPHQKGGKDFRTIGLTYRVIYHPMMLDIREAGNVKWTPDRKANVLIQYNTEKKNWDIAAFDHADANAEIKTTNIADYLAKLN